MFLSATDYFPMKNHSFSKPKTYDIWEIASSPHSIASIAWTTSPRYLDSNCSTSFLRRFGNTLSNVFKNLKKLNDSGIYWQFTSKEHRPVTVDSVKSKHSAGGTDVDMARTQDCCWNCYCQRAILTFLSSLNSNFPVPLHRLRNRQHPNRSRANWAMLDCGMEKVASRMIYFLFLGC